MDAKLTSKNQNDDDVGLFSKLYLIKLVSCSGLFVQSFAIKFFIFFFFSWQKI